MLFPNGGRLNHAPPPQKKIYRHQQPEQLDETVNRLKIEMIEEIPDLSILGRIGDFSPGGRAENVWGGS